MTPAILQEIEALYGMTAPELRAKYAEVFGETTGSRSKPFLIKRITWGMQVRETGGLSERARHRAAELSNDAELRVLAPTAWSETRSFPAAPKTRGIAIGTELVRDYKDRRIVVRVLASGFEWEGTVYKSLSAVAKAVTGSHWNGNLFFGLSGRKSA